jgi:hypothetical protein
VQSPSITGHGSSLPDDFIDTAEPTWQEDAIAACRDHVGHNSHTSKRLKHKLMNRFVKFGGAVPLPIFGYVKPPDAKTFAERQKDPAATPIYQEWFRRLRESPKSRVMAAQSSSVAMISALTADRCTFAATASKSSPSRPNPASANADA